MTQDETWNGIQNQLVNPYQLKSKKDMVDDCCLEVERARALKLLCGESCSCAKRSHRRYWVRRNVLHCGVCMPCLYRRVSLSGYYFSINEAMTVSKNGRSIIEKIPRNRILTETDAPYNDKCNIVSLLKRVGLIEMEIKQNFNELLNRII